MKFLFCGFLVASFFFVSPLSAGVQDKQEEKKPGQKDAGGKKTKDDKSPAQKAPQQPEPDSSTGKKKPAQPKDDPSKKGRGERGGELPGTDENPDMDGPLDGPIRIDGEKAMNPPSDFTPGKQPQLRVNLSLNNLRIEQISGDKHKLSATIRNEGLMDWKSGGKVIFSRQGFGVEIPRNPGRIDRDPEGPKRGHGRLGEVAVPEIAAGGKATVSIEVDNLASYFAHLELSEKAEKQGIRNTSKDTRVEKNWLEDFPGGFALNLDRVLEVEGIKEMVSKTEVRLHNGKGTMEIPGFITRQEFEIPDEPLNFGVLENVVKIEYSVHDINARSTSIKFREGKFIFDLKFETQDDEVKVGGNPVTDVIYPNVQTEEFRIKVEMPLSFNRKLQLFELDDARVTVTADWEFDTVPGVREVLSLFLGKVNEKIESGLRETFDRDVAEMIEWQLNHELRDNLLPIGDRYGNLGEITRLDFEGESEIRVYFSQPK